MHIEIQVALNFIIGYLYNRLPRRRVNIFAEELEKALKAKFRGHWYPDRPYKGSAYRCINIKIDSVDAVLHIAARESGICIFDILEHLPQDMAIWVDPGEVSYRIGERGPVNVLYNEMEDFLDEFLADREVTRTFNPEAQCFQPTENYGPYYAGYSYIPMNSASSYGFQPVPTYYANPTSGFCGPTFPTTSTGSTPIAFGGSPSPIPTFLPRTAPLTFTTAAFAQTKFGSTKLKTNYKRTNRMSPSEFSNYIKQREMQQQMQQQMHHHQQVQQQIQVQQQHHQMQHQMQLHQQMRSPMAGGAISANYQNYQAPPENYYFHQGQPQFRPQYAQQNIYDNCRYRPDAYNSCPGWENFRPHR